MDSITSFQSILDKFRQSAYSERDKGDKFERLMQAYLQTDPQYTAQFSNVWLWNDFFARTDFGGNDTGIDLVAKTFDGDFWAIQCKFYQQDTPINKPEVDTFLSTSGRSFINEDGDKVGFSNRLWIATTSKPWGTNAEEAIRNQEPPVNRLNIHQLDAAPVDWAKIDSGLWGSDARTAQKTPFGHQTIAIDATHKYFETADRGKLIMACGTGKTYTALKIAEKETGGNGLVLFLVPSISLLGQTLREWSAEAAEPIHAMCICSDPAVSQKRAKNEDTDGFSVVDLALPASTFTPDILKQFNAIKKANKPGMTVVFSTYQSIEVIAKAQKELLAQSMYSIAGHQVMMPEASNVYSNANANNTDAVGIERTNNTEQTIPDNAYGIFDLIICDEAHRTTGVTMSKEDASAFVKVHDNNFLRAKKRLYMTATPRLYHEDTKSKAARADAVLCSMDDPKLYGGEIYHIGFGEAVEKGLLTDYKVLILTVSENDMPAGVQEMVAENGEINSDDAAKLIGCINALSKKILGDAGVLAANDPEPMRRAVAFCQNIPVSKSISGQFNLTRNAYFKSITPAAREKLVTVDARHVDGTMSAPARDELLGWLKAADADAGECRVLTNVRCLSEGVDVPSLDAVLFLSARNSQVDVVQSVGRVMRKAPGKRYGYIIIPVVVPASMEAHTALDSNDRYNVVWSVLNALRAHDDRFNATVNKIELNNSKPSNILVGRPDNGLGNNADGGGDGAADVASQLSLQFEQLQNVVFARMVEKVGDRRYWEQWAADVAVIAERQIERINKLITQNEAHQKAFAEFLKGLHNNINPAISHAEAVEMLAQHMITRPVFEALFEGYSFVKNNPISVSMQQMLDLLEDQGTEKDTETLQRFYESVKKRASGVDNGAARQRIIVELYDKFFKTAFPKMVEKLGIVYTPVEVVDFIVHSVDAVLRQEFGRSVSDENVHILDPFTGTGTFMTRLLQSGLIAPADLQRKYTHELHANEIVLLAYYIAAINIENAYHAAAGNVAYQPFDGICLTDTFQLGETDEDAVLYSDMFPKNSERVQAQKKAPLTVIMGNPPYSVGQKSANDNAQNQSYAKLDKRIAKTYAEGTDATNKNSLYDSYIKAFRWSTDRLDNNGGVIAFVSNAAWLDGNATDGFRKCLQKEFSAIYVFNLRGNQRTSGELSRKEGGKIFGSGSRTPIAITFLVKKPDNKDALATIYYRDIGDYLTREEKLGIVGALSSIGNPKMALQTLLPNEHGDWLNHRNDVFGTFIPIGEEKKPDASAIFCIYSNGLKTNRDAWCYNSSSIALVDNIKLTVDFYNSQRLGFHEKRKTNSKEKVEDFIFYNSSKISWNRGFKEAVERNKELLYNENEVVYSLYRPFFKQVAYFSRSLNDMVYLLPSIFPKNKKNLVICVSGVGVTKDFSTVITDTLPDLELIGKSQCFPLYYYIEQKDKPQDLFSTPTGNEYERRDGVSDFILEQARKAYDKRVNKEDIFYYVYGLLHSPEYRERFASDLKKMLPRLPLVEEAKDFWAYSKAGRKLAELHINYETVPPADGVTVVESEGRRAESGFYRVEKMRFPSKDDKSKILYNSKITVTNIPAKAYEYVVNGKSAIEWIMERYQVTINKDSQIRNDPNDWAPDNERYILDLLLSVIRVSVETVEIVNGLPVVFNE